MADADIDICIHEKGIGMVVNPDADKSHRHPTKIQSAFSEFMNTVNEARSEMLGAMKERRDAVAADINAQTRKVQMISKQIQEKLNL